MEAHFLTSEELLSKLSRTRRNDNGNEDKNNNPPVITLLDLRTEHHLQGVERPLIIKTEIPIRYYLLDDLQKYRIRAEIPKTGTVVTITETGNRDTFAIRYLRKYGYKNVYGLLFGMRGWIKAGYPAVKPEN